MVVASLVVTGSLVLVRDLAKGTLPKPRVPLGLAIGGVVMAIGAEVSPELVGPFAALVLVSAVFVVGGEAFTAISRAVKE